MDIGGPRRKRVGLLQGCRGPFVRGAGTEQDTKGREPVLSGSVSAGVSGGVPGTWSWASQALKVWAGRLEKRSPPGGEGTPSFAPGRPARADGRTLPFCCRSETSKWSWETITFWTFRVRADVRVGKPRKGSVPARPAAAPESLSLRRDWALRLLNGRFWWLQEGGV